MDKKEKEEWVNQCIAKIQNIEKMVVDRPHSEESTNLSDVLARMEEAIFSLGEYYDEDGEME